MQKNVKQSEYMKFHEAISLLFEVSKELIITTLNSLFNEDFKPDKVEMEKIDIKYLDDFDLMYADVFFKVTEKTEQVKLHYYHIEIQTEPNINICLGALQSYLLSAERNAIDKCILNGTSKCDPIYMPKSVIIHTEDGDNIPDEYYDIEIVLPNGGEAINHQISVLRYWEYDMQQLIDKQLHLFLPLQLLLLRPEFEKLTKDKE